jgi:hypothetical protein
VEPPRLDFGQRGDELHGRTPLMGREANDFDEQFVVRQFGGS